ncbi:Ubiquitin-like superfamily protein [Zea mays]|uniref:Ubiquitin-like superfamily protein n=1 Tax=Zea mays TaxID=4577 RepID=A0A1D6DUV6_MAIZE|nr:Ubiquitin-like superfamily protein [Zea mays]
MATTTEATTTVAAMQRRRRLRPRSYGDSGCTRLVRSLVPVRPMPVPPSFILSANPFRTTTPGDPDPRFGSSILGHGMPFDPESCDYVCAYPQYSAALPSQRENPRDTDNLSELP